MPKESKSGKGSRSSKTARVLSLLTDPEAAGEEKTVAEEAAQNAHDASVQLANDANTQAQIRDALESELIEDQPKKPTPRASAPKKPAEKAPAPAPTPKPAPAPQPKPAPAPAPKPAPAPVPQSAPAPTPKPAPQPEEEEYTVLNVTQALVEEKADKYMKMFGMCTCKRCRIDVIAMALSNLPAKYVVVKGSDINPRLSYYESKYSAAVITSVMSACKKVLEKPHHER